MGHSVTVLDFGDLLGPAYVDDLETVSDDGGYHHDDGANSERIRHGVGEDLLDLIVEQPAQMVQDAHPSRMPIA
jgi:hypothetical protein